MAKIGAKLRELRRRRSLPLREVALRAGLSHAAISMIERDKKSPSVDTLVAILDVLGTTISGFFDDVDRHSAATPFYSRSDMIEIGNPETISYLMLGASQTNRQMLMLLETFRPGARTRPAISHAAQEAGMVVSGSIKLTVDGNTRVLNAGDGYYFDSRLTHLFENVAEGESMIVSCCTPPTY